MNRHRYTNGPGGASRAFKLFTQYPGNSWCHLLLIKLLSGSDFSLHRYTRSDQCEPGFPRSFCQNTMLVPGVWIPASAMVSRNNKSCFVPVERIGLHKVPQLSYHSVHIRSL